jgi:glycosyltransferase involved in cell wall biosynthesis
VELGFLEASQIPSLLAAADVLVQPGAAGAFNDYRFPCKIPEFLASGKPTALPATNVGLLLKDREEALLLARGDREEIGRAIATLAGDADLRARLGRGGRAFAERNFRSDVAAASLVRFYEGLIQSRGAA